MRGPTEETGVCGKRFLPPGGTVSCWEPDEQWNNAPGDFSIFGGGGGCLKKGESSTGQHTRDILICPRTCLKRAKRPAGKE